MVMINLKLRKGMNLRQQEASSQVIYLDQDSATSKHTFYQEVLSRWHRQGKEFVASSHRSELQATNDRYLMKLQKKWAQVYKSNVYVLNKVSLQLIQISVQKALKIQHWFFKRTKADLSLSNLNESLVPLAYRGQKRSCDPAKKTKHKKLPSDLPLPQPL